MGIATVASRAAFRAELEAAMRRYEAAGGTVTTERQPHQQAADFSARQQAARAEREARIAASRCRPDYLRNLRAISNH